MAQRAASSVSSFAAFSIARRSSGSMDWMVRAAPSPADCPAKSTTGLPAPAASSMRRPVTFPSAGHDDVGRGHALAQARRFGHQVEAARQPCPEKGGQTPGEAARSPGPGHVRQVDAEMPPDHHRIAEERLFKLVDLGRRRPLLRAIHARRPVRPTERIRHIAGHHEGDPRRPCGPLPGDLLEMRQRGPARRQLPSRHAGEARSHRPRRPRPAVGRRAPTGPDDHPPGLLPGRIRDDLAHAEAVRAEGIPLLRLDVQEPVRLGRLHDHVARRPHAKVAREHLPPERIVGGDRHRVGLYRPPHRIEQPGPAVGKREDVQGPIPADAPDPRGDGRGSLVRREAALELLRRDQHAHQATHIR